MSAKIKTIIIDDEKLAREITKKYLENYPDFEIAAECSNGFEGIKKINEEKPDLIFLDIQMPKINGFEMLELLDENPVIIFTTAFDHYALKAFEVNAADYLLKPFSKERFDEAVGKAFVHLKNKKNHHKIVNNLIEHNKNTSPLERVIVKEGTKISIIPVEEIKWIEAQDDYVMIHTGSGKHLKQQTMKHFEAQLNSNDFLRIHRSFIVAIKEIKKLELLEKESYQVYLDKNISLPVSKTGYDKLKAILK
jgi:two-component system, LytTR family, response regulator